MHRHTDNKSDKSIYAYKCGHFSYYSHIVSSGFMYIIWKELTKHSTNEDYVQYIILYIYMKQLNPSCVFVSVYMKII